MSESSRDRRRKMRALIRARGAICEWCGWAVLPDADPLHGARATLDHIEPLFFGGANGKRNLVVACYSCNQTRGHMLADHWRRWLEGVGRAWAKLAPAARPRVPVDEAPAAVREMARAAG